MSSQSGNKQQIRETVKDSFVLADREEIVGTVEVDDQGVDIRIERRSNVCFDYTGEAMCVLTHCSGGMCFDPLCFDPLFRQGLRKRTLPFLAQHS